MSTTTANPPAAPYSFRPQSAEALWQQVAHPSPVVAKARHLGEALVHASLLPPQVLVEALQMQQQERSQGRNRLIGQILVERGALTQEQLRLVIATWLGEYTVHPGDLTPEAEALALIPRTVAEREAVLPLIARDDALVLLMDDPLDRTLLSELRFLTERRLIPLQAAPGSLLPAIYKAYPRPTAGGSGASTARSTSLQDLLAGMNLGAPALDEVQTDIISESDNTVVRLVNAIIDEAVKQRASDIHIEASSEPQNLRIRLRIDGKLAPYLELPARYRTALMARVKIMAGMDVSEHRKPQDGKIDFARFGGPAVELRVVSIPTTRGLEDLVLRLLAGALPLEGIGLSETNLLALRSVVQKNHGLVLVCGPTGSGKTTTMHSVIRDINTADRKIWTAEDPIEITQEGLRQVQVNPRAGWTFAAAIRAFLRADPDAIMIGEMRDEETARIAIEATLTGHLVLSTLHASAATPESIARLLESSLDSFQFSSSLLTILNQRLVRRLCPACREPYLADQDSLLRLAAQYLAGGSAPADAPNAANSPEAQAAQIGRWRVQCGQQRPLQLWRRVGCNKCEGSGYRGRLGLHALVTHTETMRQPIRHPAQTAGMLSLRQDGIEKVLQGLTDIAEVMTVT